MGAKQRNHQWYAPSDDPFYDGTGKDMKWCIKD